MTSCHCSHDFSCSSACLIRARLRVWVWVWIWVWGQGQGSVPLGVPLGAVLGGLGTLRPVDRIHSQPHQADNRLM